MDSAERHEQLPPDETEQDEFGDRYPDPLSVIERVVHEDDFPSGDVERIEITMVASGEATWRVWAARAEEPVGGVIAAD
jgi:cellulase/cellobiase CelA1